MAGQAPAAAAGRTDDEKLKGAIAYVLGFITGIIILLIAGDDKFLKFHAWQSIVASIALGIIFIIIDSILTITVVGVCLVPIISLLIWIYFLYAAYQVYTGNDFRMPIVADFVQQTFIK